MAAEISYERGELALTDVDAEPWVATLTRGRSGVTLSLDDLRWLVLTAGPAALYELVAAQARDTGEEDAGGDGGSPPAEAEATEATDGQLAIDVEPVRGDQPGYFAVACPTCGASRGRACTSPGGLVSNRPHAARRKLVEP